MALPKPITPTYELKLPSTGKTIKFRPFLVKEEKILLMAEQTEEEKQIKDIIKEVIKNCIISRIKLEDLTYFDLEYVFLQLRARSAEENVELIITCRDDETTKVNYTFNLLNVEVQMTETKNKIMLGDDSGLIMKYPGLDEFVKFSMMGKGLPDSEVLDYVASKVDQIFQGEEVFESADLKKSEIVDYLGSLTQKQFANIGEFFDNLPVLKHTFTITNPNTGVDSEYTLEGLSNFFGM
jgi:hypothetical protein